MSRCSCKTKDGRPCRANAGPSGKCALHSTKNRAHELASKSAAARREAKAEAEGRLLTKVPETPDDLVRELTIAFAELANGRLDQNRARALATVANVIFRGFEIVDVKKQLANMELLLKERP